jgi:uncharacterized membrane protein YheB (UPF0754 family)
MKALLAWLVPPLAGGVIGFVTNVIAIRMLFRPLSEVRLAGIRLPFTPGILPRRRHELAEAIGAMVERELLTPEILRLRLAQDDVKDLVRQAVTQYTARAADVTEQKPNLFDAAFPAITASFIRFLQKEEIHRELETQGRLFLGKALSRLSTFQRLFLTAGNYDATLGEHMGEIIDDLIRQIAALLGSAAFRPRMTGFLWNQAAGIVSSEEALEKVFALIDEHIPDALAAINVRQLVTGRIDSLEMIKVERIVLDVMANQFKWIDIFGAVLGFMIGLFQAALSHFLY